MIERNGEKLYTIREIAKILCIGGVRIQKAMNERTLIPTDIEPFRGRMGFRYLFSEKEITRYAEKVGLNPIWDRANQTQTENTEKRDRNEIMAELDAKRELRKVYDPKGSEEIKITADNVHEIFGKQPEEPIIEDTEFYFVKIGKTAYITTSRYLTDKFIGDCMMQKDCAEKMAEIYGGKVMRVCAREAV